MSDQLGSSRLRVIFESALQDYEAQAGTNLIRHPLAEQLERCDTVEAVISVLREQAGAFGEFRGSDGRIMRSLERSVSVLYTLSASTTLSEGIGLTFPPARALFAGLSVLLGAVEDVKASYDALVDLLESIEHFLNRLSIYTNIPLTGPLAEIIVKIMVELLSTLALVTKQVKQKRPMKFVKKLLGESEVEAVLQRLDRLTLDEARTTAAQTLEVVYGLVQNMRVVMGDRKASVDDVRNALEIIQQIASNTNKLKRDKLQQDVRNWLSPPDPWKNHNVARESRHTGTAEWFVQSATFAEWKSSGPGSLLWIHGKPGAGKTVLCSKIIQDIDTMRKSGLASLMFFYCDFREDQKRDRRGLLSSLLVQLCHQSNSYCDTLSKFYLEHGNGSQHASDDALVQCFKDLLKLSGQAPIYLVIDALDECPNSSALPSSRTKILNLLKELVDSQIPNFRICVTSRPEMDIKIDLDPLTFRAISLHDESGQIEDINNYIKSVISTDPRNRRWSRRDKQLVIDALTRKARGMFRWVYCQAVYLSGCLPGRIQHALAQLPETLDQTYTRTLREINDADWDFAHRLFQCVAVASRPLRVEELAEFLAFDFETSLIPQYHEDWRQEDPVDAVLSTCSSLLAIVNSGDSAVIQFSHFSVKEYLTSTRLADASDAVSRRFYVSMASAHTLIAQACLGILLHLDEDITSDTLQEFPLIEYAAQHWIGHAQFEDVSQSLEDGMKCLFHPGKPHLALWLWIYDPQNPFQSQSERNETPLQPSGTPLHYAVICGLPTIVKFLVVDHSQDVNAPGFNANLTPLHLTSDRGNVAVARVLLEHGADTTARAMHNLTPLHQASYFGHVEVARLLLEHGADAVARAKYWLTPLHYASSSGCTEVVRVLLEHAADVAAQTIDKWTPLHQVARDGHPELARILVEYGADPKVQDSGGWTPLHAASHRGCVEMVRIFLERTTDVAAQNKDGRTPLHSASIEGHVEVVCILLQHGADVATQDERGWTPLHSAAKRGRTKVVSALLGRSADTTTGDKHGRTPLHLASRGGHAEVVRTLLGCSADAAAQEEHGWTPLHWASRGGHVEVARILLEHGADAAAQDKRGWTPLHWASRGGHLCVARILLQYGADLGAHNNMSRQLAFAGQHRRIVELLSRSETV